MIITRALRDFAIPDSDFYQQTAAYLRLPQIRAGSRVRLNFKGTYVKGQIIEH